MEELDPDLVAQATRVAALDQEQREWSDDAEKIASFWSTLKQAGIPDDIAGPLTINAQVNYYSVDDCDDDD